MSNIEYTYQAVNHPIESALVKQKYALGLRVELFGNLSITQGVRLISVELDKVEDLIEALRQVKARGVDQCPF